MNTMESANLYLSLLKDKWPTLTNSEKDAIAEDLAGIRGKCYFVLLMDLLNISIGTEMEK